MISEQHIQSVVNLASEKGLSDELISDLRAQFPDYHFTYCMDDDMDAHTPAQSYRTFNVYFVNSTEHCSSLTRDPAHASGFVLAEVVEDE